MVWWRVVEGVEGVEGCFQFDIEIYKIIFYKNFIKNILYYG